MKEDTNININSILVPFSRRLVLLFGASPHNRESTRFLATESVYLNCKHACRTSNQTCNDAFDSD